jgi:parallel beta-helix repeat protein
MSLLTLRANLLPLAFLASFGFAPCATATTYYVSTTGSDSNSGSSSSPFATWQKGLNTAVAGDTVQVQAGTYRNQTVSFPHSGTSGHPITLAGASGATVILKGSTVVSAWVLDSGSTYRSDGWTHYYGSWSASPHDARDEARNQLFVNGVYIQEVATKAAMFAGSFFIDQSAQKIYLRLSDGSSPSGKTVEVTSTAGPLLTTNSQNCVSLQNLQFQHCANLPQGSAAVQMTAGNNCTAASCTVQWAAGAGFELAGSENTVTGCVFNHNGQLGMHSSAAVNCLVQNCETSSNNTLAGKQFDVGWEAGGNKFAETNGFVLDHHLAHDNYGSGIWFDVDNEDATITNCTTYLNMQGIQYEISYTALIANNLCYNNRLQGSDINSPSGQGIYISSSAGCLVYNNVCWGNDTRGVNVGGPLRDDGKGSTVYSYANELFNNICVQNQVANSSAKDYAIPVSTTADPGLTNTVVPFSRNLSDYNLFYRNDTHSFFSAGGTVYSTLASYQSATGEDLHSVWGDPLFVNSAGADFHLAYTSPGVDAGTALSDVLTDHDGVSRPQGFGYDIGAYEKPALAFEAESLTVVSMSAGIGKTISNDVRFSGGAALYLNATAATQFITLDVPNVAAGTYDVRVGIKKWNNKGAWQCAIQRLDGVGSLTNVGPAVDEYDPNEVFTEVDLGNWAPGSTNDKAVTFTVTGKNAASSGYQLAIDYLVFVPQ